MPRVSPPGHTREKTIGDGNRAECGIYCVFWSRLAVSLTRWWRCVDFSFGSEAGGNGSLDQDSLGGGVGQSADEQEVASLTTLNMDSESSSLSQHGLSADTVTITGDDTQSLTQSLTLNYSLTQSLTHSLNHSNGQTYTRASGYISVFA